jgi:pyrroline-5-carboxylate reductase
MRTPSIGFIGGGRVVTILLGGWARAGVLPPNLRVTDNDGKVLDRLASRHPSIEPTAPGDLSAARQDIVFLALHPPAVAEILPALRGVLRPDAMLVSLAPKFTIARLSERLGGFRYIARAIPNAPSIVNAGFNPVAFGAGMSPTDRERVFSLFRPLGQCPEVSEDQLEAYAILSAMGPTYFWPQFVFLEELGIEFGLSESNVREALGAMVVGAVETLHRSGLSVAEVEDLIPVMPMAGTIPALLDAYRTNLTTLMDKIRPA